MEYRRSFAMQTYSLCTKSYNSRFLNFCDSRRVYFQLLDLWKKRRLLNKVHAGMEQTPVR